MFVIKKIFKGLILNLLILLLFACQKEPMIRISEENQAEISAKKEKKQEENKTEETKEVKEDKIWKSPSFNKETLKPIEEGVSVSLLGLMVEQKNQIKQVSNGVDNFIIYVDYFNENTGIQQVRTLADDGSMELRFNRLTTSSIENILVSTGLDNFLNYTGSGDLINSQSKNILLQVPLIQGESWQVADGITASVTGLYQGIPIFDLTEKPVVEITTDNGEYQTVSYYVDGAGLVALWQKYEDESKNVYWEVTNLVNDSGLNWPVEVAVPSSDNTKLEISKIDLPWQTNKTLSKALDELFKDLGWLDDSVSVNYLDVKDDYVILDFTEGVVASLNKHEAGEEALIPAIVTTVSNLTDYNSVRLSVNGNGLLPDKLAYPEGGIWQVDKGWLSGATPLPSASTNQEPAQESQQEENSQEQNEQAQTEANEESE